MARSEDAIRRRALKRQRTEEEQRQIDGKALEEAKKKRQKKHQQQQQQQQGIHDNSNPGQESNPLEEIGAWKCPSCGNENFASRNWCNSKTCDQPRPSYVPQPKSDHKFKSYGSSSNHFDKEPTWICPTCQYDNFINREVCNGPSCQHPRPSDIVVTNNSSSTREPKRKPRHDPETSKPLVWSKQADPATFSKNQLLRQRYMETDGEGMSEEEKERAKILIERDERKRLKKLEKANKAKATVESTEQTAAETTTPTSTTTPSNNLSSCSKATTTVTPDSRAQRLKNKKLREEFRKTNGQGMTPEDMERAKLLLARDERKRSKVAAGSSAKTSTLAAPPDSQ